MRDVCVCGGARLSECECEYVCAAWMAHSGRKRRRENEQKKRESCKTASEREERKGSSLSLPPLAQLL